MVRRMYLFSGTLFSVQAQQGLEQKWESIWFRKSIFCPWDSEFSQVQFMCTAQLLTLYSRCSSYCNLLYIRSYQLLGLHGYFQRLHYCSIRNPIGSMGSGNVYVVMEAHPPGSRDFGLEATVHHWHKNHSSKYRNIQLQVFLGGGKAIAL